MSIVTNTVMVPQQQQQSFTSCSGRVVGVASAAIGAGLDMYANGVKPSNIAGGLCGAVVGYVAGNMVDGIQSVTGRTSAELLALTAVVGFTTAVGTSMSCRGLDPRDSESMPEFSF